MPMAADVTDDERAQKCREHSIDEAAARKKAGLKDWYLPGTFQKESYLFGIDVITRLEPGWEDVLKDDPPTRAPFESPEEKKKDPFGTFLSVNWGVGEFAEVYEEDADKPWPETD